jgi:hypothetical protein
MLSDSFPNFVADCQAHAPSEATHISPAMTSDAGIETSRCWQRSDDASKAPYFMREIQMMLIGSSNL